MAGLLNPDGLTPQGRQAPQGMAPEQGAAQPQGMQGGDEDSTVSPEEQQQYDQFVTNGMSMAYDEEMMPDLLRSIEGDGDPAEGLGNTVAMIVLRLEDSAKESGVEISGDVMYHGAVELVEQLAEFGEEAGILENTDELRESAFYTALDVYRSIRQEQGTLPVEEISQDMAELEAADQSGTVDQLLPGISQASQGGREPQRGAT